MARGYIEDPAQKYSFALIEASGVDPTSDLGFVFQSARPSASTGRRRSNQNQENIINQGGVNSSAVRNDYISFTRVKFPSMDHEQFEIQEGNWPFVHKIPMGSVSVDDMVLERGIVPTDCDAYVWFMNGVWGSGSPRRHFVLLHLDRSKQIILRKYRLKGCWAKAWTPDDLDAEDHAVSFLSLTVSVEQVQLMPSGVKSRARL